METLRSNIVDTINELNKLIHKNISDEEKNIIRKRRRLYFALLEEVIVQEIPKSTEGFDEAIEALQAATKSINETKDDLEKISDSIKKVSEAAEKIEKIVKIGIKVFA